MAALRVGELNGCPHEVLDPRDLKFIKNQTECHWRPEDDPFRWREKIPLARWGLAEVQLMGWPLLAITIALAFYLVARGHHHRRAVPAGRLLLPRSPATASRKNRACLVSPADGKVIEITQLDHDDFVGGPAVRIAIFLTLFNVHVNRMPCRARVIRLKYSPGKFLNASSPEASTQNESMWIGLEQDEAPYRRMVCRQVSGLVARRIVCDLRPGQVFQRGAKFGMIKLGSRTELIVPAEGFEVRTHVGQWIKAGRDIVGSTQLALD